MSHTPGRWTANKTALGGGWVIDAAAHHFLAGVYDSGAFPVEANARLIAAAPDLLDVCESLEKWEAAMLQTDCVWADGLPRLSRSLFDQLLVIQAKRNHAVAKAKGTA